VAVVCLLYLWPFLTFFEYLSAFESHLAVDEVWSEKGKKFTFDKDPTRQRSTSRTKRKCLSVMKQQIVFFLISSQIKISKRCLFDISLMSKLF
jgi:hypothetical protein